MRKQEEEGFQEKSGVCSSVRDWCGTQELGWLCPGHGWQRAPSVWPCPVHKALLNPPWWQPPASVVPATVQSWL